MPATVGRTEMEGNRPMTSRARPKTCKSRPKTTRGTRPQYGSVESLESRTSSEQTVDESRDVAKGNNDSKDDRRLLNRDRAKTAPASKYHSSCSLSSSSSDLINSNYGPRSKSSQGYPTRDQVSRVSDKKPGYYEFLRPYSAFTKPLWKMPKLPVGFQDSKKLTHPSLTQDERFYLWRTATVYGMTEMRKKNQERYEKLLRHTVETGFHTEEEIKPYLNYFKSSRKRQFQVDPRVWRDPPRVPVRPQHFRPPPTSQQGWSSYSPRGNLGSGRGHSARLASSAESKNDEKEKKEITGKKKRAPGVGSDEELEKKDEKEVKENNNEKQRELKHDRKQREVEEYPLDRKQPNNTDLPRDEDEDSEFEQEENVKEEQKSVHIYYDMKLKRTVIKPIAAGNKKDSEDKMRKSKENKVTFQLDQRPKKEQRSKGQVGTRDNGKPKGKLNAKEQMDPKSPRPPPPRRSWEKNPAVNSARPKTSRGNKKRVVVEEKTEEHRQVDDEEADGRQSAASSISRTSDSANSRSSSRSSTSSSGSGESGSSSSSSSGSSSSSSGSSRSSSVISRSDSAMSKNSSSRNSTNGPNVNKEDNNEADSNMEPRTGVFITTDESTRPKVASAVGNQVNEGEEDDSRAALADSFWESPKHEDQSDQKPHNQETADSSPGGTGNSFGKHDKRSSKGTTSLTRNMVLDSYTIRPDKK